eukprot:5157053-Prymnesium_polylepis.1
MKRRASSSFSGFSRICPFHTTTWSPVRTSADRAEKSAAFGPSMSAAAFARPSAITSSAGSVLRIAFSSMSGLCTSKLKPISERIDLRVLEPLPSTSSVLAAEPIFMPRATSSALTRRATGQHGASC